MNQDRFIRIKTKILFLKARLTYLMINNKTKGDSNETTNNYNYSYSNSVISLSRRAGDTYSYTKDSTGERTKKIG